MQQPGDLVAGCRLEEPLGAGAMGAVWRARHPEHGQVVLKFLESRLEDARLRDRLLREGRALQRLPRHPALIQVYAIHLELDPPCLMMEFVPGTALDRRLAARGPFPPREAARLARDVAAGMAVVHARGLLHRDLKPANLLLTPAQQVRIVDFGLVKEALATALTEPGQLLGTGPYMAPECWRGELIALPAQDVFALGATLYELIAGEPPFLGRDLDELSERVQSGRFTPLAERAAEVPAQLDAIVRQMLAGEVRFRYASIAACRDDLERFLHGEPLEEPRLEGTCAGRPLRVSLVGLRRLVIGSDPACELQLAAASVAPRHAQLRRKAEGWQLRDLKSPAGTWRGDERVRATPVVDGDVLRFGRVVLHLRDPRGRAPGPPWLQAPARRMAPEEEVLLLAQLGDPRALSACVEGVLGDPSLPAEAAARLTPLGGDPAALGRAVARAQAERRAWLLALDPRRPTPAAWLEDWRARRAGLPPQWGPATPPRVLTLHAEEGEPGWEPVPLDGEEVLLVGRDPKCHVRLRNRTVSRHHATLLRVQRGWVLRDEGRSIPVRLDGAAVGLAPLEPGQVIGLADVRLRVVLAPPQPDRVVGPLVAAVLLAAGHPGAARLALDRLRVSASCEDVAARLFPDDPARAGEAARLLTGLRHERQGRARAVLARLLAAPGDADLSQLAARLAAALPSLGPQARLPGA